MNRVILFVLASSALIVFVIALSIIGNPFFGGDDSWTRLNQSRQIDDMATVINAIDRYLEKNNALPESIYNLIPNYLDRYPEIKIGKRKLYYSIDSDGKDYVILIESSDGARSIIYYSYSKKWVLNND